MILNRQGRHELQGRFRVIIATIRIITVMFQLLLSELIPGNRTDHRLNLYVPDHSFVFLRSLENVRFVYINRIYL